MAQMIDMFMIWGDLLLMTENAFVLFTMIVHAYKIVNHLVKRDRIQEIVKEADLVLRDVHSEEEKKIVKRSTLRLFCMSLSHGHSHLTLYVNSISCTDFYAKYFTVKSTKLGIPCLSRSDSTELSRMSIFLRFSWLLIQRHRKTHSKHFGMIRLY